MAMVIPLALLPPNFIRGLSQVFKGQGGFLSAFFPGLNQTLAEAEVEVDAREYAAIAFTVAVTNALIVIGLAALFSPLLKSNLVLPGVAISIVVGFASFFTVISYPRVIISRKVRLQEDQLIPATRQLLIELRSGVPLFNAMTSVSTGYGEISLEFRRIVNRISGGVADLDALAEATRLNSSLQFRKVLWQISNALKVGSDVGESLATLLVELERERITVIHRYGQELSPWTMVYMLAAVVVPSLGVTMLIVLTTFLNVALPAFTLNVLLALNVGFQLFFMNFIASRRPLV